MGVYSYSSRADQSPGYGQPTAQWGPSALLEIINPVRGSFTCVGYAPSCRRRCQNPINQHNQAAAYGILHEMEGLSPNDSTIPSKLKQLACYSLCLRYHQGQVESVVAEWLKKIQSMPVQRQHPRKFSGTDQTNKHPTVAADQKFDDMDRKLAKIMAMLDALASKQADQNAKDQKSFEDAANEKEEQEERAKSKQKVEEQDEEASRQRKRAEKEHEDREREKREQEVREEEARRAAAEAQRVREEKAKEAREKVEREKKEIDKAWHSYIDLWAIFRGEGQGKTIPWPVKSGNRNDVNASTVETFLRQGLDTAVTPAARFKLMQAESKKWHPDKISHLFPNSQPSEVDHMIVDAICKVVIRLRAEARKQRNG